MWTSLLRKVTYTYGTTLDDSDIASSLLLRKVAYPDSAGGGDVVESTYNRQGQQTSRTDQNGTVHEYDYDALGRPIHDRVTTLGEGIDDAVRRLSTTYNVRGLAASLTSHDNAAPNAGAVLNEVRRTYNAFNQVVASAQGLGPVVSNTPTVGYAYADGSDNTIRPTELHYPNGRVLTYEYSGAHANALSRISGISESHLLTSAEVSYSWLGLGTPVLVGYGDTHLQYTLVGTTSGEDPDTGDIYRGLDRFGRIKDCRWIFNVGATPPDRARIQYGYNRAGSRVWRKDVVAAAAAAGYDELYYYDGLQRLSDMQRGTLNSGHTALTSETLAQCWTLDATGNWGEMRQAATGGAWTLEQTRTANTVNEITAIGAVAGPVWATPEYDPAGNMTTIPQPSDPTRRYTATYDAWNRLVKLTEPEESSSSSSVSGGDSSPSSSAPERVVAEYQYDARRFRIWQKEYSPATQITQVYYTEAWQAIEERNAPQTIPHTDVQYIWGIRYIDDLVRRDRMGIGPIDDQLYVLQDANWNVIAITNASVTAAVQERYAYSAYGEPLFLEPDYTPQSSSQFAWTYLYTGLLRSPWTGLIAARNRLYQPGAGVWLSRNPVTYIDSSNLYLYVKSRPVSLVDPSGLADVFDMWDLGATCPASKAPQSSPKANKGAGTGPWHKTYHSIDFKVPSKGQPCDQLRQQIFNDLKSFKHFNPSSVATVSLDPSRRYAYFDMKGWEGWASDNIVGNADKSPVYLEFDPASFTVTATTMPGHMLEGRRVWMVDVQPARVGKACSVVIATMGHERPVGNLNRAGAAMAGTEQQLKVWDEYLMNIKKAYGGYGPDHPFTTRGDLPTHWEYETEECPWK